MQTSNALFPLIRAVNNFEVYGHHKILDQPSYATHCLCGELTLQLEDSMLTPTKNWWVLLLRGVLAIVFVVTTFAGSGMPLDSLILLFGAFAFADGVMHLIAAVRSGSENWWASLLAGLFSIGTGLVMLFYPGLPPLRLLYFIAFWLIACGVTQIIGAIRLRREIEGESPLALDGFLSVSFGIFLVAAPGACAVGLLTVIATYAYVG